MLFSPQLIVPPPRVVGAAAATTTTLNPADKGAAIALSGGNLVMTGGAGNARSISSYSTGKFYYEVLFDAVAASAYDHGTGLANASASLTVGPGSPDTNSAAIYLGDPALYSGGASAGSTGITIAPGDLVGFAVDIGAGLVWVRANGGLWNNSGANNPATGVGGISIAITKPWFVIGTGGRASAVNTYNFGASAYANAAPSGYGNF